MVENKFLKNFITLLSGNAVSQMIPFVVASFLSRIFLPNEFGLFSNILAISTMIGIVSSGRLELAIPLPKRDEKAQDIIFVSIIFTLIFTLLSLIIYLFDYQVSQIYNNHELRKYLFYVPLCVLSFGLLGITNNWILRQQKIKTLSTIKIIQSIINNFGALGLGLLGFGLHGLIISWLLSQYLPIIYITFSEKIKIDKSRLNKKVFINVLKTYKDFPLINSLHAFTDIFATQVILFWIISHYFGEDNLGLFTQMNKYIKAPIVLITSSVSQVFFIEVSKSIHQKKIIKPYFYKTIKTSLFFAVPFVLIIFILGPQLFSFFFGKKFIDYSYAGEMAKCILPTLFFMFLVSPTSGLPILFKKQAKAFMLSVFGYTISLSTLLYCSNKGLNVYYSLTFYSLVFGIYFLVVYFWYFSLVKNHDNQI